MKRLDSGESIIDIVIPNGYNGINFKNNHKIMKELGGDFFQKLRLTDPATGVEFVTNHKYLILSLPFRRQSQHLVKKMSMAEDSSTRDDLTGQPTGKSKGSSLSNPEAQVLHSLGLDFSIEEMIKARGGDQSAFVAYNKMLQETGGVDLEALRKLGTKVKSTEAVAAYYRAQHYDNNMDQ